MSCSQDNLLRVWALHSLDLVATLPGHRDRVRCLTRGYQQTQQIVYSGSDDKTVRVWDLSRHSLARHGSSRFDHVLRGHTNWVRSVVASKDGRLLFSGSKEVRVWDTLTLCVLHTLRVGSWVFCLAVYNEANEGGSCRLYAGLKSGRIACWSLVNLPEQDHARSLRETSGKDVRALATDGAVLYAGYSNGLFCAWDVCKQQNVGHEVRGEGTTMLGHEAGVRSICTNIVDHSVVMASDDRSIRVWTLPAADAFGQQDLS